MTDVCLHAAHAQPVPAISAPQFFEVDLPAVSEAKIKLVDRIIPDAAKVRHRLGQHMRRWQLGSEAGLMQRFHAPCAAHGAPDAGHEPKGCMRAAERQAPCFIDQFNTRSWRMHGMVLPTVVLHVRSTRAPRTWVPTWR